MRCVTTIPNSTCTLLMLRANHFTFWGGWVILKKISCKCTCIKKNFCTRPSSQNNFTHVQWAGKKFLQDVPCGDILNFCIRKLVKDFSTCTW